MFDHAKSIVLVIDDEAAIGEEVCDALELRNCNTTYAENLAQARSALNQHPDLRVVVVDFNMPQINGAEVIETLTKEFPRHMAFIVLTGDDTQAAAAAALRARAFDFLKKPVDGRALSEAIERALARVSQMELDDPGHSKLDARARALAKRLESVAAKLSRREALLRTLMLANSSPGIRIPEDGPTPLTPVMARLKDIRSRVENSGSLPPAVAESALDEAQQFADAIDHLTAHDDAAARVEKHAAVDLCAVIKRLLPAFERMAKQKQLTFKSRAPAHLPNLCADEPSLARALTRICRTLLDGMTGHDQLTLTAIKEGNDVVLTFRIQSPTFDPDVLKVLVNKSQFEGQITTPAQINVLELVDARIAINQIGGSIRLDEGAESQWFVRVFFPLRDTQQSSYPPARATFG